MVEQDTTFIEGIHDLDAILGLAAFAGVGILGLMAVLYFPLPPLLRAAWQSFRYGGLRR